MQRITLSIDDDLAEFFDRYAVERGYRNRSEAMRDILRNLASNEELSDPAPGTLCVGAASYIYDHHERQLAMRLTELQHEHGELVISQMHAHVNGDDCLETVFLKGPVEAVRGFADALVAEPGVKHGYVNIIPLESDEDGCHHHPHLHRHADGTVHSHE